jgi:hypothetical protein
MRNEFKTIDIKAENNTAKIHYMPHNKLPDGN